MFLYSKFIKLIFLFFVFSMSSFAMEEKEDSVIKALSRYQHALPCISKCENANLGDQIAEFLLQFNPCRKGIEGKDLLTQKIKDQCEAKKPLKMLLLGFPFKSTNRDIKCISGDADMAEYLSFMTLSHITEQIQRIYTPGASITILSDGLAYQTVIDESEDNILKYQEDLDGLIKTKFPSLKIIGWKFNDSISSPQDLIQKVDASIFEETNESKENEKDLREFVKKEFQSQKWEDHSMKEAKRTCGEVGGHEKQKENVIRTKKNELLKQKIEETTKSLSMGSMKFGKFIEKEFPNYDRYLRLSVHPHANVGKKLGISLIVGQKGTPWHNALVLAKDTFRYLDQKTRGKPKKIEEEKVKSYKVEDLQLKYLLP